MKFSEKTVILKDNEGSTRPQILAIAVVSIAMFNFGMTYAWSSPYFSELLSKGSAIPTRFEDTGYLLMTVFAARAISAPIFSILVDIIGRRDTVIFTFIPYTLSWLFIYFAKSLSFLYISRILNGIADAAAFTAITMYVGEIAEPSVRGTWGSLAVLTFIGGQLAINIMGCIWNMRTSALVCSLIPPIYAAACLSIPRSPYYLIMRKRDTEAVASLQLLRRKLDVHKEFLSLQEAVKTQTEEEGSFLDLIVTPSNRKASLISVASRAIINYSGLPVFSFYTQYIFQEAGSTVSKSSASITYITFYLLCSTFSGYLADKAGRKPTMIFSTISCSIFLTLEAIYFFIKENGYSQDSIDSFGWVPLAGLIGFIGTCSVGISMVPSLMLSELFPVSVKGKAMCVNNVFIAVNYVIVAKLFQLLASNFGMFGPFAFFSICTVLGVFFSVFWLPETKGKTLDEIHQNLKYGR